MRFVVLSSVLCLLFSLAAAAGDGGTGVSPAQWPPIAPEDVYRFGGMPRELTLSTWRYLRDLEDALERRSCIARLLRRPFPNFADRCRLNGAKEAWNLFDNATYEIGEIQKGSISAREYRQALIENLGNLRALIGPENYYAGRLPDVDEWRWWDACLSMPIP